MNVLFWAMTGFLLILGVATLWEWLQLHWSRPKLPLLRYEVIPLGGDLENGEQLLRYVSLCAGERRILFLDNGLSPESRELFLRQLEDYSYMELCDPPTLWKLIFRLEEQVEM